MYYKSLEVESETGLIPSKNGMDLVSIGKHCFTLLSDCSCELPLIPLRAIIQGGQCAASVPQVCKISVQVMNPHHHLSRSFTLAVSDEPPVVPL